ncbi:MAG: ATP-dependent DNA helicase, partial [Nanoarchaeota archaeon]
MFPYESIREIQNDFINDVASAVGQKKHLIMHAPTGIGKTAGVLSAIVPHILDNELTLFFLTSRHTQHRIAVETLKEIRKKHGVNLNVVDLIGKRNMCSQFGADAMGGQFYDFCKTLVEKKECEFYENTYSNIGYGFETRKFLEDKGGKEVLHVEEFLEVARKTKLCPYELAILKAKKASIVIADYSYIFNPSIRDAFFRKSNKSLEKSVIIVDEAHNLPGRLRDMMSSSISAYVLEQALKEARAYPGALSIILEIKKRFDNICDVENERMVRKEEFIFENISEFIPVLDMISEDLLEKKKRSFTASVSEFLKMWPGDDNGHARYVEKTIFKGKDNFRLNYKCLDPSFLMKEVIDNGLLVLMSGTLMPLEMYRDLLGFRNENVELKEYTNPFPIENRLNMIVPETTTKYTKRSNEMFKLIAKKCSVFCTAIPGNILILFPSYEIMKVVNESFSVAGKSVFVEMQGMNKEEKEKMLKKFKEYKNSGAVLLGVAGANFSEGIDLPGDELNGVIIVGLPLSRPDLETKSLIEYYDQRFDKGWDYGYIFPAMKKVVQGAGRCIRSEKDKGVIIFLDERYSLGNYLRCFPKDYNVKITKLPEEHIKKFFE